MGFLQKDIFGHTVFIITITIIRKHSNIIWEAKIVGKFNKLWFSTKMKSIFFKLFFPQKEINIFQTLTLMGMASSQRRNLKMAWMGKQWEYKDKQSTLEGLLEIITRKVWGGNINNEGCLSFLLLKQSMIFRGGEA